VRPVGGAACCWGVDDIRVQVAAAGSRRQIREVSCTLIPAEWEEKEEKNVKKRQKWEKQRATHRRVGGGGTAHWPIAPDFRLHFLIPRTGGAAIQSSSDQSWKCVSALSAVDYLAGFR
jgi:hypothetical protein